jgi:hypothetical protein
MAAVDVPIVADADSSGSWSASSSGSLQQLVRQPPRRSTEVFTRI